jgi:proline-specific peptidase
MNLREEQGFVPVEDGYRVWYWSVGGGGPAERIPLLLLHGGPGAPHDYLENLKGLASPNQRVVFYDQLGCGRSDKPDEPQRWRVPRFVSEVDRVRKALGLRRIHILGQSWGGMLAIEYALTQPPGLASLILASSTPSAPLWAAEANRLRAELPPEVQQTLAHHEAAGTTDSPDYHNAMTVFYDRHVIRVKPMPDYVQRSFDAIGQVYLTMQTVRTFLDRVKY